MGGTPGHRHLYRDGSTAVHRLPAHLKVVAALVFALAVVTTRREHIWAFGVYAALVLAVVLLARLPFRLVAARMVVEVPFVLFAVLLPFVALGPRVDVLGLSLAQEGLWGGWNVLVKGTLGVLAAIVLAATTTERDLVAALQRLRVPTLLVQMVGFMLRYATLVTDQLARMRIARESRAFEPRHLGHLPVLARSAGASFIRTYERGERVHLAMLSRGYTGTIPMEDVGAGVSRLQGAWLAAALVVAASTAVVSRALP